MNLNQLSTANLRLAYKHGRISEQEFIAEIEQREDEQEHHTQETETTHE